MTKFFRAIVALGLIAGATVLALGVLAHWVPALDIVNNGLPFLATGAVALLALAFALRARLLIGATAILLAATLGILLFCLQGRAPEAPQDAERFLRVVTFNLWGRNDHDLDRVAKFIKEMDADAVVLEDVRSSHAPFIESLDELYAYRVGDNGLVILSKHAMLAEGRNLRAGQLCWMSRNIRWVQLGVNGKSVTLVGVHLTRPFYPALQKSDIEALTRFAETQSGPLILAGDFNMTPWTVKMRTFTEATNLGRYNTYYPTWPMRWRSVPLLPLLPIDNIFASEHFANISTRPGPRLDSDHRALISDLALIE
ncbi:MAG: endonuclease/exonuclease/phosphatase family protein [Alphaproteobacteria bacterium]